MNPLREPTMNHSAAWGECTPERKEVEAELAGVWKQEKEEQYGIAWTQNGRVRRWGSFCERLRHGSTFLIKSGQHAGLNTLSPLHSAKPHELEDIPSLARLLMSLYASTGPC